MIRAIVVDDEFPAREELKYMLSDIDEIELVGEASNALEALSLYEKLNPDLMFLDIEMPRISGIELAKLLMEFKNPPKLIFVTAYDEFAIDAFDVNAVDYILKPIEEDKLKSRIKSKLFKDKNQLEVKNLLEIISKKEKFDRITVYKGDTIIPINIGDILYITVENKKTYLITEKDKYSINASLNDISKKLSDNFFRSHKSFIVNIDKIDSIEPWFNSTFNISLKALDEKIPVSRSRVKEFKKIMNMD